MKGGRSQESRFWFKRSAWFVERKWTLEYLARARNCRVPVFGNSGKFHFGFHFDMDPKILINLDPKINKFSLLNLQIKSIVNKK